MAAKETAAPPRDKVDDWLAEIGDELPGVDLTVEAIVNRIQHLTRRLKMQMEETLADHDLSPGEFQVLCALEWSGAPYRSTPGKLAKRSDLSSGAMTNRLDRLERAGLIERLPDQADRRGIVVQLTDAGRQKWEEALGAQAAKESLIASALDEEEKDQLNALLRRLVLAFGDDRAKKSSPPEAISEPAG